MIVIAPIGEPMASGMAWRPSYADARDVAIAHFAPLDSGEYDGATKTMEVPGQRQRRALDFIL